jgi:hypothetical protein
MMNKYLKKIVLLSFIALSQTLSAQVIFNEDFNGGNALSNWTLINNDNLTPAANVNYVTDAWVLRESFDTTGVGDSVDVSTSWYSPAGAADDYLISPQISLTTSNFLAFDAKAQDPAFPDGYELLISTTTPTIAGFNANPALYTTSAENSTWTRRVIDLSAYQNQSIYLAWRNNSNDKFLLLVDNVQIYQAPTNEAQLVDLNLSDKEVDGSNVSIGGTINNNGGNAISNIILNWSENGGTTVNKDTVTLNLQPTSSTSFSHSIDWVPSNAGSYSTIDVWLSEPNGMQDSNPTNDSLSQSVFIILGNSVQKTALLEEYTTAVCQFCPDGAWVTDQVHDNYSNAAVISVHSCFGTDAMTNTESTALCNTLGINAAPTAMVDRKLFDGETDVAFGRGFGYPNWQASAWASRTLSQSQAGSAVDINLTGNYNSATRSLNANVDASFVDYVVSGDIRVSLMLVEDSVTGTGSGYNQVNAYNTQTGHPYAGAGNPIVGFEHRRVLRDILPGTWGDASVIPSNYALNTNYNRNFTTTIPSGYDQSKMYLVGIVSYYGGNNISKYEVLNVEKIKMSNLVTSISEQTNISESLTIYPNPSSSYTNLEFRLDENKEVNLQVLDITGKVMISESFGSMAQGKQRLNLDVSGLANGIYFINLNVGEEIISRKVSVAK